MKILSIGRERFSGTVYNLGVKDDHTYFAEGALVHNCRSVIVPVTIYEADGIDSVEEAPDAEALQAMGANLLSSSASVRKFATLQQSLKHAQLGDNGVLPPPGQGTRLVVMSLRVVNNDGQFPVSIGFKTSVDAEPMYFTAVKPLGGTFEKDFRPDGWDLGDGNPLYLSLTGNVDDVVCDVSYEIRGPATAPFQEVA